MSDLTDEAKAAIEEAVKIVHQDQTAKYLRNHFKTATPADPPKPPDDPADPPKPPDGPPAPPPKPTDPPPTDPPKRPRGYWGEIISD